MISEYQNTSVQSLIARAMELAGPDNPELTRCLDKISNYHSLTIDAICESLERLARDMPEYLSHIRDGLLFFSLFLGKGDWNSTQYACQHTTNIMRDSSLSPEKTYSYNEIKALTERSYEEGYMAALKGIKTSNYKEKRTRDIDLD